jgi:hypothetical protein
MVERHRRHGGARVGRSLFMSVNDFGDLRRDSSVLALPA